MIKKKSFNIMTTVLFFIIMVSFSQASFAYVLPAGFLLEKSVKNLSKSSVSNIYIESGLSLFVENETYDDNDSPGEAERSETESLRTYQFREVLRYRIPGAFRSDIFSETSRFIHVKNDEDTPSEMTVVNDKITGDDANGLKWYTYDLFRVFYASDPLPVLASMGVDVKTARLSRFNGGICYVVGDADKTPGGGELWLDKESLIPVRFVTGRLSAAPYTEIRYEKWRETNAVAYPERILYFEGEKKIRENDIRDLKTNISMADDLFSTTYLKSIYNKEESSRPGNDEEELNNIKETIDDFNKLYQ